MAKKRFTDIEIWDKEWYMELKPVHKCLMKYIFDKCDACGCWKPNWKLASLHIGENVFYEDLIKLPKDQYEVLDSGKIFIPDFINFQYGQLSKKSPAHNPVFLALEKNNLSDRVFNRVYNTLKEKEEYKEKEKDKEEEIIPAKKNFKLQGVYNKNYNELNGAFKGLTESDFYKWKRLVDFVIENKYDKLLECDFIKPQDLAKIDFPESKWDETLKAILATGVKPEHDLYFRIPQFLKYTEKNGTGTTKNKLGNKSGGFAILTNALNKDQ